MAVTPQTNTDLGAIAEALRSRDDFIICGHVSPDGDCLGSQLGLAAALKGLGKRVTCLLAKDEPIDERLGFLPGAAELVPAASFDGIARTFVAVDVPTRERIGEAAAALLEGCDLTVTVDHHAVDSTMTDLVYVDPDAASTTMLVWELAGLLGAERAGDVAQCCYTGLVTDTGRFQYQNRCGCHARRIRDGGGGRRPGVGVARHLPEPDAAVRAARGHSCRAHDVRRGRSLCVELAFL